jgi:hypothetical protein
LRGANLTRAVVASVDYQRKTKNCQNNLCQNVKKRNIDIVLLLPFSNTFQYIQDVKDPVKDDKLIETFGKK